MPMFDYGRVMNGLMMFDGFLGNDKCEKFLMIFLGNKQK